MQEVNRFIKVLLFSTAEGEVLLYGFSSLTKQPPLHWKHKAVSKKRQSVLTAILPLNEAETFEKSLTQEGSLSIGKVAMKSPQLVIRSNVLVNDTHSVQRAPITEYAHLEELWNVRKVDLVQEIIHAFGTNGNELYQDMNALIQWCQEECGIDFSSQGYRFGNFERYESAPMGKAFEILTYKDLGLRKITIQKTEMLSQELLVNCAAEHCGRWLINQTKLMPAEENSVEFTTDEPMSRVVVQIWDRKTGELLFADKQTMMLELNLNMNMGSSSYCISDSWTEKLRKSAPNREEKIKEKIETVHRFTSDRTVSIKSGFRTEIDTAFKTGQSLLTDYRKTPCSGAFIPNTGKDGEIDSFLKIREYLDAPTVERVIIADPYFSIQAAEKLLTRIPRTNLQLDIITCHSVSDPDTLEMANTFEQDREFLLSHSRLIHGRLSVRNLRRGDKPVFHDRYMLRFHSDHHIDGFLLSNSLNSMGQRYPFVIAPLEHEVALEIFEYLNQMCDAKIQEKKPRKEQIICDVLYDSAADLTIYNQMKLSPSPLTEWLGPEYSEDKMNTITKEHLSVAVAQVWKHWDYDKENVCRALGELYSNTFQWSNKDVAGELKKLDGSVTEFITWFSSYANEKEQNIKHDQNGINSPEYKLWALLHTRAEANKAGFHLLFDQAGHIWYQENGWFYGSYSLMLELSPESFISLLDASGSPLMFDFLAAYMLFHPLSKPLFQSASQSKLIYVRLLCSRWLFSLFNDRKLSDEQVLKVLAQLAPQKRALQTAYLLSQINYFMRTQCASKSAETNRWEQLYRKLLALLAADLPCCSEQNRNVTLSWLFDTEQCSQCILQLNLSRHIEDSIIRNAVLQEAVDGIGRYLINSCYEKDMRTAVDLYLTSAEQLYGDDMEKHILGKLVNWETFEQASEPELKNYSCDKWNRAYVRAKWQLLLLARYTQCHPEAEKALKWLNEWSKRLPDIANEQS